MEKNLDTRLTIDTVSKVYDEEYTVAYHIILIDFFYFFLFFFLEIQSIPKISDLDSSLSFFFWCFAFVYI